jgi:hypothetical protein
MDYLKEYGITDEEIESITRIVEAAEVNIDIFLYNEEKVKSILDLFKNIGVKNLYEVIITNPYMFYDTVRSIEMRLKGYKDKAELARLINEDPTNLKLIQLC